MREGIVVVGSYLRDVSVVVEGFPSPGETVVGRGLLQSHGGKGSNQAVQAARAGADVTLIAATGADEAGKAAHRLWADEGIATDDALSVGDAATGTALIVVEAGGQNMIVIDPGANARLSPAAVEARRDLVAGAGLVVGQLETPLPAMIEAFSIARRGGARTLLNAAPAPASLPEELRALIDILIVNEIEALQLAGMDAEADPREAAARLARTVGLAVVVTLGAGGAMLIDTAGRRAAAPALDVAVVDTTGAGDAFVGAFAARWIEDGALDAALAWGVAAGSLACTRRGVVPSLAGREEITDAAAQGMRPAMESGGCL